MRVTMFPLSHLFLSYSYQLHPPSGASGGGLGQGSASHSSSVVIDHFRVGRHVDTLGQAGALFSANVVLDILYYSANVVLDILYYNTFKVKE